MSGPEVGEGDEAVRLVDGELVTEGGDMTLFLAVQLSLLDPNAESDSGAPILLFCEKGRYAALADVPTNVGSCPGSASDGWTGSLFLSGASIHTNEESHVIGLSALVRSAKDDAVYRLRILGDTYGVSFGRATATFEYEPVRVAF